MTEPDPPRRPDRLPPDLDPRRGRSARERADRTDRDRPARDRTGRPRPDQRDAIAERFRQGGYPGPERSRSARPPGPDPRARPGRPGGPSGPPPRRPGGPGGPGDSASPSPARRRLGRTAKIIAAAAAVVVLVVSGVMWSAYRHFNTKISHIDALPAGSTSGGKAQNILLVGNDSRSGLSDKQLKEVGTQADPGLDTDTMLLVHIPADGRKATAVSMPRDSWVTIPGVGDNKLNAAYANGACAAGCGNRLTTAQKSAGARKLTETVQQLSGLHVDHYVEVGLLGFYDITNKLGGVTVCLKAPAKDSYSGIDLPAGTQTIKGTQALAFVRQRHGLPNSDLDRVKRQQAFLSAVADKVLSADTLLKPWKLQPLLDSVAQSLTVDRHFDPVAEMERLRDLAAGNVTFTTMPVGAPQTINGKDALTVDPAKVKAFFKKVAGGQTGTRSSAGRSGHAEQPASTVPPSHVTVQVLNGSSVAGLAAKTSTQLQQAGFQTTTPSSVTPGNYAAPEIHYAPGQQDSAHTLAGVIPGAVLKEDTTLGTTLHLIVGSGFGGVHTASATLAPATGGGGMVAAGAARTRAESAAAKPSSGPACVN